MSRFFATFYVKLRNFEVTNRKFKFTTPQNMEDREKPISEFLIQIAPFEHTHLLSANGLIPT